MNIKEAVEILKMWNKAEELVINESTDYDKTVYIQRKEAIKTLLTAYEKEKAKVERIKDKLAHLKILAKIENKDIDRIKELEILLKEE